MKQLLIGILVFSSSNCIAKEIVQGKLSLTTGYALKGRDAAQYELITQASFIESEGVKVSEAGSLLVFDPSKNTMTRVHAGDLRRREVGRRVCGSFGMKFVKGSIKTSKSISPLHVVGEMAPHSTDLIASDGLPHPELATETSIDSIACIY
jgi:hypothetical protein